MSMHNFPCWKLVAVCRKIATSCKLTACTTTMSLCVRTSHVLGLFYYAACIALITDRLLVHVVSSNILFKIRTSYSRTIKLRKTLRFAQTPSSGCCLIDVAVV